MKAKKMNPVLTFDEILKIFFNKTDINQFLKIVSEIKLTSNKSVSRSHSTEKKQIDNEPENQAEIRQKIDLLLTFASERVSRKKYILLIHNLGYFCITIGDLNTAISLFEKVIEEAKRERNYFLIKADSFLNLSEIYRRKAKWHLGFSYAKKAADLYNRNNDIKGIASSLNMMGTIYGEQGNLKMAIKNFEKSLGIAGKFNDNEFNGKIEINLGIINNILGHYDEALSHFNRALIICSRSGNLKRIAETRHNIGFMHLNVQRPQQAMNEFDRSLTASMKIKYLPVIGISYLGKSFSFALQKDYNLADAFADKALQICNITNDKLSIADVYKIKGIIQRERSNFAESENFLKTSLRINKEYGNKLNESQTFFELGILYKKIGNSPRSKLMFEEALKYFKSLKAEVKIKAIKEQISNLSAA